MSPLDGLSCTLTVFSWAFLKITFSFSTVTFILQSCPSLFSCLLSILHHWSLHPWMTFTGTQRRQNGQAQSWPLLFEDKGEPLGFVLRLSVLFGLDWGKNHFRPMNRWFEPICSTLFFSMCFDLWFTWFLFSFFLWSLDADLCASWNVCLYPYNHPLLL